MAESSNAARQQLRTACERLDAALEDAGLARPASSTISEHLDALRQFPELAEVDFGAGQAGGELLYAPHPSADALAAAARRVDALSAAVHALGRAPQTRHVADQLQQQTHPVPPPAPRPAEPLSPELLDSHLGPNPQLSGASPSASSSSRLRATATLVVGVAVVAAAVAAAVWGTHKPPYEDAASVDYCKRVLVRQPRNLQAHERLANHYLARRNHAPAIFHYERIIWIDPKHVTALNNLAWILLTTPDVKHRNPTRALTLAQRAAAASRNREAYVLDTLAVAYFQNGQKKAALDTIMKALALEPENRPLYQQRFDKMMGEEPPGHWEDR